MTVRFQAFHSIKAIGNREVLFNWSRTNPSAPLIRCGARRPVTSCSNCCGNIPSASCGSSAPASFEPIHSVYAEGSQALLVDLNHLRGQLDKTADTVTYLAGTPLDTVYADLIAMDRMLPASPASSASRPWAVRSAPAPMGRDCTSPPCAMRWLP